MQFSELWQQRKGSGVGGCGLVHDSSRALDKCKLLSGIISRQATVGLRSHVHAVGRRHYQQRDVCRVYVATISCAMSLPGVCARYRPQHAVWGDVREDGCLHCIYCARELSVRHG